MSHPLLDYIDSLPSFGIGNISDREFRVMENIGHINHIGDILLLRYRSERKSDGNYHYFTFYIYKDDEMWYMSRAFLEDHPTLLVPCRDGLDRNDIVAWGLL